MTATASATTYNREPSKILGQVQRGETVFVEKHGETCAIIIPSPPRTSGADLARRMKHLKPAPEAADAVAAIIKGLDHAGKSAWDSH